MKNDYLETTANPIWRHKINEAAKRARKAVIAGRTYGEDVSEEAADKSTYKEAKKAMNKASTPNEAKTVYYDYITKLVTVPYRDKFKKAYNMKKAEIAYNKGNKKALLGTNLADPISSGMVTAMVSASEIKQIKSFTKKVKELNNPVEINSLKNDYLNSVASPIWRAEIRRLASKAIKASTQGLSLNQLKDNTQNDKDVYKIAKAEMSECGNEKELQNLYNDFYGKLLTNKYKEKLNTLYKNKQSIFGSLIRKSKSLIKSVKTELEEKRIIKDAVGMFKDVADDKVRKTIYEQTLAQLTKDTSKEALFKEYKKYDKNAKATFRKTEKLLGNTNDGQQKVLKEATDKLNNVKNISEVNDVWKEYKDRLNFAGKTKLSTIAAKIINKKNKFVSLGDKLKATFKNLLTKFRKNPIGTLIQLITGKLDLTNSSIPSKTESNPLVKLVKNIFEDIKDTISGWFGGTKNVFNGKDNNASINPSKNNFEEKVSSHNKSSVSINGISVNKPRSFSNSAFGNMKKSNAKVKSKISITPMSTNNATVSMSSNSIPIDAISNINSYNGNDLILTYLDTIANNTSLQNNNLDSILYTLTQLYNLGYNISNDKLKSIIESLGGSVNSNGKSKPANNETTGTASPSNSSVNVTGKKGSLHDITTDMTYNKMMEAINNSRKNITNNQSTSQKSYGIAESTALIATGI